MDFRQIIFDYIFKRRPKRTPVYHSYRSARRILILFESDLLERNVQLKALVKQLKADGKDVTAWGFVPGKKAATSAILRDYRVLAEQDFTFWGWPQEGTKADISREEFDLLIDLNVSQLRPLRYLSIYANADFRCGMQTEAPYLSDFMIDLSGVEAPEAAPEVAENKTAAEVVESTINPAYLFDQILHYLKLVEETPESLAAREAAGKAE